MSDSQFCCRCRGTFFGAVVAGVPYFLLSLRGHVLFFAVVGVPGAFLIAVLALLRTFFIAVVAGAVIFGLHLFVFCSASFCRWWWGFSLISILGTHDANKP